MYFIIVYHSFGCYDYVQLQTECEEAKIKTAYTRYTVFYSTYLKKFGKYSLCASKSSSSISRATDSLGVSGLIVIARSALS